jgi:capsular exopolysaccharide synthesis family protein
MESPKTAGGQDSPLHFLDYWRIIRIRKTVILAVFLLVLLTTAGVTMMLKPSFLSTARIAVEKESKVLDGLGRPISQTPFDPYFVNTEFEKIQSSEVLYPVIQELRLWSNWAKYYNPEGEPLPPEEAMLLTYQLLRRNLDVRQSRNTSLIEIRVFSRDAKEAASVANAIASGYDLWRSNNQMGNTVKGIRVLEEELIGQSNRVVALRSKVDDTRTRLNIPETAGEGMNFSTASVEREMVATLSQQIVYARAEFTQFKTQLDGLRGLETNELRKAILTTFPGEEILPKLLADFSTSEQMVSRLRTDYSDEFPEMKRAVAVRDEINRQIVERIEGMMLGLENRVAQLKERYDSFLQRMEEGKSKVTEEAKQWREFYSLKKDEENEQRIYDALYLRTLQEKVDSRIPQSTTVAIVDKARPALRPVRPNITLNLALGAVFGLVMGIGLAFFIEYLDTSVKTIDDVERAMGAPVLGVIPQNVGLLLDEGPDSPHAESYRVLRTNVLFSRKRPDANTLTVVSGGAGEGKSTTIFNLATVFSQQGQRVLVVDSDLRRPSLHKFVKISNSVGLTNYLLKQNTLEEVIQTTKNPLLDFLPSGKLPSSSLGILNSQRMKDFIKEIKTRYDFVFFDSPPIMGVSDASILASEVDLAILVVQYRKYPQAMTIRAKQMVEKVGGTLLGVVLNNINISQDSYYYYYSGYYYDYYSKNAESEPDGKSGKSGKPGKETAKLLAAKSPPVEPAAK